MNKLKAALRRYERAHAYARMESFKLMFEGKITVREVVEKEGLTDPENLREIATVFHKLASDLERLAVLYAAFEHINRAFPARLAGTTFEIDAEFEEDGGSHEVV